MSGLKPNAELAYAVLDHIDAKPEEWDQGLYIAKADCGTVGCFAGLAVLLSGAEPVNFRLSSRSGYPETDRITADGMSWHVGEYAEHLLRVDRFVLDGTGFLRDLFDQDNTREDLGRLVEEIFGPRPPCPRCHIVGHAPWCLGGGIVPAESNPKES